MVATFLDEILLVLGYAGIPTAISQVCDEGHSATGGWTNHWESAPMVRSTSSVYIPRDAELPKFAICEVKSIVMVEPQRACPFY